MVTLEELRGLYLAAQLRGDRRGAIRLLLEEGLGQGARVEDLQFQVIGEAQQEIGRLWQENRISIAQEHLATAISQLALAQLFHAAQARGPRGKKVLVACVEGELHDFPARLLADHLELEGYEVRFLGASVPTDSLLQMVRAEAPDLLALSVTMNFHLEAVREAMRRLRTDFPLLPVVLGGHACGWMPGLAGEVDAQGSARDAREATGLIARVLGPALQELQP